MRFSKIYSNKPAVFSPIVFKAGINVVLAEIRLPENRKRDTHNLGKTTLGRLLDFTMLSKRDPKFFLFKHEKLFAGFIFFLEIQLKDDLFITVRRGVDEASKISFKRHEKPDQNYSMISDAEWDHPNIPFDRAREILDSFLDWRFLNPWDYRKIIGYLLRSQDDYQEVFHLRKFASKHADWKPFLAHILGFNGNLLTEQYKKEEELEEKEIAVQTIKNELGSTFDDLSKIEGYLLLKRQDSNKKQLQLDEFDFRNEDKQQTKHVVNEIDERIAEYNQRRYSLNQSRKKLVSSLEEDQILFNPAEAEKLFQEAGILFGGQIKKDFQQLLSFNKAITDERRTYLQEELSEIDEELKTLNSEIGKLNKDRSETLAYLSNTDIFEKYKRMSNELVVLKAEITSLERQRNSLHRMQELRNEVRTLSDEKLQLQTKVEADVNDQNSNNGSLFSRIRIFFSEIVEDVIDRKALLNASINQEGHLEFSAEILDESGNTTSADMGHTYRKLLCIAFDLAILRAHVSDKFPKVVYHDGVFESLDDRKKENLLEVIRQYANYGIQEIVTLIDSDLPQRTGNNDPVFSDTEIVLHLHDENEQGRLFKCSMW